MNIESPTDPTGSASSSGASCDLCGSLNLEPVYRVPDSNLGAVVSICGDCGLVQSLRPGLTPRDGRVVAISCGADWGNIRHAKRLRLDAHGDILKSKIPWNSVRDVLDIGSNRGAFVRWVGENCAEARVVAIEPDGSIVEEYRGLPNLTLHVAKSESVDLGTDRFDLVYCCQTLEHADSALAMLKQLHDCLRPCGLLFVEVPNLDGISLPDVVEEFFMDKHRFHFSRPILRDCLRRRGFDIVFENAEEDRHNILILSAKAENSDEGLSSPGANSQTAGTARAQIEAFAHRLSSNRARLTEVGERLNAFGVRQSVAYWGAGRIFDSLVRYGGLDVSRISCLVDRYLYGLVQSVHGVEVRRPECLKIVQPQVIVVLARSSADQLVKESRSLGVKNVIKFGELLV